MTWQPPAGTGLWRALALQHQLKKFHDRDWARFAELIDVFGLRKARARQVAAAAFLRAWRRPGPALRKCKAGPR